MNDKYPNFEALAKTEIEGRDFSITHIPRDTKVLIMGPHAGAIEPGTSEIARAIAGEELSLYLFEGIKRSGNGVLHITSTNFDEPHALKMLKTCQFVLAFHGEGSENQTVYLGGQNQEIQKHLKNSLEAAGFTTKKHENPGLQGTSDQNICNRGTSKQGGVQLELGKGLRKTFFESLKSSGRRKTTSEFEKFSVAVRVGLEHANLL